MKCKKLVTSIAIITIAGISPTIYAKKMYPAEIVARDLNYPGLG